VNPRLRAFVGGKTGLWSVMSLRPVLGEGLPESGKVDVVERPAPSVSDGASWVLRGVTSHVRYSAGSERAVLAARQVDVGRPTATRAALIPIRKNAAWWDMPQDDRRRIFEETSRHITIGLKYLPAISRRLHHCRDLSEAEPFDFLTWFDFAPEHASAFEDLVGELRSSEEWTYVDREVDIRLAR